MKKKLALYMKTQVATITKESQQKLDPERCTMPGGRSGDIQVNELYPAGNQEKASGIFGEYRAYRFLYAKHTDGYGRRGNDVSTLTHFITTADKTIQREALAE